MKKVFAVLLAILLLSATGCTFIKVEENPPEKPPESSVAAPAENSTSESTPMSSQPEELDEYASLRATIAYSPTQRSYNEPWQTPNPLADFNADPTARAIADLLAAARVEGCTFASVNDLSAEKVLLSAIQMTQGYVRQGSVGYGDDAPVGTGLEPIYDAVSEKLDMVEVCVWIGEHVEQSARRLYGPDYQLQHQSVFKYEYFPEEKVYTPPHMGGGSDALVVVFDYAQEGETMTATVAYLVDSMGGFFPAEMEEFDDSLIIDPEKAADYLQNEASRYTVTLKKAPDDSYYIVSQAAV